MKVVVNAYGVLPDEFYFGEEGMELTLCVRTVVPGTDQTSLHQADQESGEVFAGIIHQILSKKKEITKTQWSVNWLYI